MRKGALAAEQGVESRSQERGQGQTEVPVHRGSLHVWVAQEAAGRSEGA